LFTGKEGEKGIIVGGRVDGMDGICDIWAVVPEIQEKAVVGVDTELQVNLLYIRWGEGC
jgi:hypothetical protein